MFNPYLMEYNPYLKAAEYVQKKYFNWTEKTLKSAGLQLKNPGKKNSRWEFNAILKNGVKLGEALKLLPFGIIDKKITGIGGTTLELLSKRNSIIVEPLKSIASSKALLNKSFLYVGSPNGVFKNKISVHDISSYHKSNVEYKKIIVVADSLGKVISAIGESVFKDYYFMIDEIDSFQSDSSFRDNMELCLDYYKRFPRSRRCMITATMLNFTDPDLRREPLVTIDYETSIQRHIKVIETKTLKYTLANEILKIIETPGNNVVVAYNAVADAIDIINFLVKTFHLNANKIKIACSVSSKDTASQFYGEIENQQLPARITFLTSAYFTGVDIDEDYHSIAVINGKMLHTLLSDHKLKQIAGRCRKNLLSETVIYSPLNREIDFELNKDDLFRSADKHLESMKCFELQYQSDPLLRNELERFKDVLVENASYRGYKLVRKDINGKLGISFCNIDSILESLRIKNQIYSKPEGLINLLKSQGHLVDFEKVNENELEIGGSVVDSAAVIEDLINQAFEKLKLLPENDKYALNDLIYNSSSAIQNRIYEQFKKLTEIIDKDTAYEKLKSFKVKDTREFNNYHLSVTFEALTSTSMF